MRVDTWRLGGEVQQFSVSTTANEEHEWDTNAALARLLNRMATNLTKRRGSTAETIHVYPSFLPTDELGNRTLWSGTILWQKDVNG